jgi:transcriptional regulator with XRE-family HTH domain
MHKNKVMEAIGKKVRAKRLSMKMTQEKLALEADLDLSYYTHFENGRKNISIQNLLIIAKILDTEVSSLLPGKNEYILTRDDKNKIELDSNTGES